MSRTSDRLNYIRTNFAELSVLKPQEAVDNINGVGLFDPINLATWASTKSVVGKGKETPTVGSTQKMPLDEALALTAKFDNDLDKALSTVAERLPAIQEELKTTKEMLVLLEQENRDLSKVNLAVETVKEYLKTMEKFKKVA